MPKHRREHKARPMMVEELKHLADQARSRRLGHTNPRLSQVEFARTLGVSNKTLDNIEAARNWPSMPVYIKLCRALGVGTPPLCGSGT